MLVGMSREAEQRMMSLAGMVVGIWLGVFGPGVLGLGGWGRVEAQTPGIVAEAPASGPFVKVAEGYMVPYEVTVPGTEMRFTMIPIPGGKFSFGSPTEEPHRGADEGPQVELDVEPYWMAKCEVTWGEYQPFMGMYKVFKLLQSQGVRRVNPDNLVDAITAPTPLYEPSHTFHYGDDAKQPAVTMTQYAAKQYCKWLGGLVKQQLRLPTEVEWEYAAKAGSKTAYSFGDSPAELAKYAAYAETNPKGPSLVGGRAPNAFGLHDMHGNVWEWVIDGYDPEGHGAIAMMAKAGEWPVLWSDTPYPRTVRGGGWQDSPERLRSAARMGSDDEDWKEQDPNVPRSPWWFTNDPTRSIGFRMVRSYKALTAEQMQRFWNIDAPDIELDVQMRLDEGRGAQGLVVPELLQDLEKVK